METVRKTQRGRVSRSASPGVVLLRSVLALMLVAISGTQVFAKGRDAALIDQNVRAEVMQQLHFDQAISSDSVSIDVSNGMVKLDGTVSTLFARVRAERVALTVRGVRAVENDIRVMPASTITDAELKTKIRQAIADDPASHRLNVDVNITDGAVALGGSVDSWQQRHVVEDIVCKVAGVCSIDNAIDVRTATSMSDDDVENAIEDLLRWDVLIDDGEVDVKVENGIAFLRGSVGTAAEKHRALSRAHEAGVVDVNVDGLSVELWTRDEDFRDGKYDSYDDADINHAVVSALDYNVRLDGSDIMVNVADRVATLEGNVNNLKAKRIAAQSARNIVGVVEVNNQITVVPNSDMSDNQLAETARTAVARDSYLDMYTLKVTVRNNVAYLSGSVDSYYEKAAADDAVARVEGITAVVNNIDVSQNSAPLAYNPWVDEYMGYEYDWWGSYQPAQGDMSDQDLRGHIVNGINASAFIDSSEISVTVRDGAVFLNGRVASQAERAAAERDAYSAGAALVYNNIRVR